MKKVKCEECGKEMWVQDNCGGPFYCAEHPPKEHDPELHRLADDGGPHESEP